MGKRRLSGEAGKRVSNSADQGAPSGAGRAPGTRHDIDARHPGEIRETPILGKVPRFEVPDWRERYGVVAGITGRGSEPGRGFDLGLWSAEPVGEVMSRWLAFRRELPEFPAVALGNQVHGVEVMNLESGRGWIQVEGIDGWVTTAPGIVLTVTVADCVPVYLLAPGKGVGLLHAGWRGTAGGILGRGIERLRAETGSMASDLIMHCGVGICGRCYEVGSEVMAGCGAAADGPGPWHLDLREQLVGQARKLGLARLTTSGWCSAHDDSFFSHRASRGSDGRMVAYIGMSAGQRGSGARKALGAGEFRERSQGNVCR